MKKILPISLLAFLSACGPDPGPGFKFQYLIKNQAGFAVIAYCAGCDIVNLSVGQQKQIETNTPFADYTIEAVEPTNKFIESEETSASTFTITSYSHEVKYRVSGSTSRVDVSFINSEGSISTFSNVEPGVNYEFKDFSGKHVELSAKITGVTGDVLVYIFHKDKIIKNGSGTGAGTTVTISATID